MIRRRDAHRRRSESSARESATSATEGLARAAEARSDRMVAVLDALPLGVIVVDAGGAEVVRNAEAVRLLAARDADALAARALTDALASGEIGQPRTIELHGPPPRTLLIDTTSVGGPEAPATVAVVQDITERRRLDAVRRDFIANVSHELRTPIGALTALADTLTAEDEPQVMRRLAGRVAAEAERAGHLIDDLLDLSRIEAGDARRAVVSLAATLAKAVERVRPVAREASIELEQHLPGGDVDVFVDETQIVSALTNLLENGVKYSEAGTHVIARARMDGASVVFEVQDQGIGIPPADRERIFERFYRVDPARSRATGGTGLGLAIVRHVAQNHGGDVQLVSREGEGSTFTLRLPQPAPHAGEDT